MKIISKALLVSVFVGSVSLLAGVSKADDLKCDTIYGPDADLQLFSQHGTCRCGETTIPTSGYIHFNSCCAIANGAPPNQAKDVCYWTPLDGSGADRVIPVTQPAQSKDAAKNK